MFFIDLDLLCVISNTHVNKEKCVSLREHTFHSLNQFHEVYTGDFPQCSQRRKQALTESLGVWTANHVTGTCCELLLLNCCNEEFSIVPPAKPHHALTAPHLTFTFCQTLTNTTAETKTLKSGLIRPQSMLLQVRLLSIQVGPSMHESDWVYHLNSGGGL